MKFENYMTLDFPSKSTNEAFARSAVACFAAQMDPTLEELGDIRTAVSEAVTNCIVHAYPNGLGSIYIRCRILKDNVLDIEDLSCKLIEFLVSDYSQNIISRYKIEDDISQLEPYEILELIAKKRGMLISKGEVDYERAAIMFVDEFRAGKLGRITLELPEGQ